MVQRVKEGWKIARSRILTGKFTARPLLPMRKEAGKPGNLSGAGNIFLPT
jgi:hypothetical protein